MFYQIKNNGLLLSLKISPNASQNKIHGKEATADGGEVLRVMVTTAPEAGKANEAVIKLLSKLLKIPKSSFRLLKGETSRNKTLLIVGDAEKIKNQLLSLLP